MFKRITVLTLIVAFLFGTEAYAHSGRTDSSGGHNCSDSSKAKGLCTGYHYHNGGGSTTTSSPVIVDTDKDCTDFATYDEMVAYWNSKGYSATYDPENLDGWGNGVVDDGIPCEVPNGYDKTKINNSPEQIQFKQDQQDMASGEKAGYPVGLQDGYSEQPNKSSNVTGTQAYKDGYIKAYNQGFDEGTKKITAEKTTANQEGYALGQKEDTIAIPAAYTANPFLQKAFEEGFNKAMKERVEAMKKELNERGYSDGKKDIHSPPANLEEVYLTTYEEGYKKGQVELKEDYVKQGYDAAFTMVKYKAPSFTNAKFIEWYKEGFDSNKEVEEVKETALTLGHSGEPLKVPSKYKNGEILFKHYYEIGYKEYEKKQSNTRNAAMGGVGAIVLGWLGRRFYVTKKKKMVG